VRKMEEKSKTLSEEVMDVRIKVYSNREMEN